MLSRLQKLQSRKSETGFTIIEIMIVLAIAGLIILIVFLAVPALQRNSRNTQRKSDASHLASLVTEWESNNVGSNPTSVVFSGTAGTNQIDATTEKFSIITTGSSLPVSTLPGTLPAAPAPDTVLIYSKATCTGNSPAAGPSIRAIVVWYGLEGGTKTNCIVAS